MNELREERGTIITWLEEETIDERIDVIPVWKWLLAHSIDYHHPQSGLRGNAVS